MSYAPRGRNAYYREHFCQEQYEYRLWKCTQLKDLGFKINKNNTLKSISHPIFSALYENFILIKENNHLWQHQIAQWTSRACMFIYGWWYFGYFKNNKPNITVNPIITLYTLNFSEEENIILQEHIYKSFNIRFNLKRHPDGKNIF